MISGRTERLLRAIGCVLMFSGWLIVLAALTLLGGHLPLYAFVLAGLGVEVLGIYLLAQSYREMEKENG